MTSPLISIRGLKKTFGGEQHLIDLPWRQSPEKLTAVDGVDLDIFQGEALGIVGESGCGKSTLARCLVGIYEASKGEIRLEGRELSGNRTLSDRRRVQIVFQDPYSSLNPRMTVDQMIGEVLRVHNVFSPDRIEMRIEELLGLVGLAPDVGSVYPRHLSGGQRQRVSIARALAVEPEILIADEPVSALDVSVQATVLNLLAELRDKLGVTLVMIAHDLSVVRHLCDRVGVMYLGRIVETARTDDLFANPRHPYTRGLLAAAPSLHTKPPQFAAVKGDPPSPYAIPDGCRFHPRCPMAVDVCSRLEPALTVGPDSPAHRAACHFAWNSPVETDKAANP